MSLLSNSLHQFITGEKEEKRFRREVKKYGLEHKSNTVQVFMILFFLAISVITFYLMDIRLNPNGNLAEEISALISVAVAMIAYQQWRASRHEISIDKYYDRLEEANKRLEALGDASEADLHAYIELDKLEYVIVKYELGFISAKLSMRAIENFACHCKHTRAFKTTVEKILKISAYLDKTKNIVPRILSECSPTDNCQLKEDNQQTKRMKPLVARVELIEKFIEEKFKDNE